ncbi:TraX family protein [Faecalimonas sp.]
MKIGLNSFQLKIIAVITMIIDHVGLFFFPQYTIFRIIGRISFPIFAFLVVEGFYHTSNILKYMLRLGVFAIFSEIPFDLLTTGRVLDLRHQNVFFTLLIGVILLYFYEKQYSKFSKVSTVFLIMLAGDIFRTDYGAWGVLMIFCFFIFRERLLEKIVSILVINVFVFGNIQMFGALALLPICLYNGKKGKGYKYFFYFIYPVHLWIIWAIKIII